MAVETYHELAVSSCRIMTRPCIMHHCLTSDFPNGIDKFEEPTSLTNCLKRWVFLELIHTKVSF